MRNDSSLLMLLRYCFEDSICTEDKVAIQRLIKSDPVLLKKLKAVRRLDRAPRTIENLSTAYVANVSADEIAAFLDGTLTHSGMERFENRCWKSKKLLVEVIENFKFSIQETDTGAASDNEVQFALEAIGIPVDSNPVNEFPVNNSHLQPASPKLSSRSTQRRSKVLWVVAVAAGILLMTGFSLAWTWFGDDQPDDIANPGFDQIQNNVSEEVKGTQPEKPKQENGNLDGSDLRNTNDETPDNETDDPHPPLKEVPSNNEEQPIEQPTSEPVETPKTNNSPKKIKPDKSPSNKTPTKSTPRPNKFDPSFANTNDPPALKLRPVELRFRGQKRGAIVQRSSGGEWIGIDAKAAADTVELYALPDSWAQVQIEGIGLVTLTANTHIKACRLNEDEQVTIELIGGEIILPPSKEHREFRLSSHLQSSLLLDVTLPQNSGLMVSWTNRNSFETYVFEGMAQIVRNSLFEFANQQNKLGGGNAVGSTFMLDPSNSRTWHPILQEVKGGVDMKLAGRSKVPNDKRMIKKDLARRILRSEEVKDQLVGLLDSRQDTERAFAEASLLSLYPAKYFAEWINSEQSELEELSMEWLVQQSPTRLLKFFKANEELRFPNQFRYYISYTSSFLKRRGVIQGNNNQNGAFSYTVSKGLVGYLDSEHYGVRRASHLLLEAVLGKQPIQYSAAAPPHLRADAISLWDALIEEKANDGTSAIGKPTNSNPAGKNEALENKIYGFGDR